MQLALARDRGGFLEHARTAVSTLGSKDHMPHSGK